MPKPSRKHQQATQQVLEAGRGLGAAAVFFHTVVAERQGLNATEEKILDLLQRHGPRTPGQLARDSGLAPPSVTGLVDRLSRKGFVRRVPDPEDRRRVRVELIHERIEAMAPLFTGLIEGLVRVCRGYSADDLTTIARWLEEAADCQRDAAATLAESDAEG